MSASATGDFLFGFGGRTAGALETWPITISGSTGGRTLDSYGTGRVTLAPTSGNNVAVSFGNVSNVNLANLIITGPTIVYSGTIHRLIEGIYTDGSSYTNASITGCTISNGLGGCLIGNTSGVSTAVLSNITFNNNTCFNLTCRGGFETGGRAYNFANITANNNVVYNVTGIQSTVTYAIFLEGVNGATVNNNTLHDIAINWTNGLTTGPAGLGFYLSTGCVGKYNVVYNIFTDTASPQDGVGFDIDLSCSNCAHMYSIAYNCHGAGFECNSSSNGNACAFNILSNCMIHGADAARGVIDIIDAGTCAVYGTTVVNSSAFPAVGFWTQTGSAPSGKTVANCVLICPTGVPTVLAPNATGLVMNGNYHQSGSAFLAKLAGTSYSSLAAWRTASGLEASGVAGTSSPLAGPTSPPPSVAIGSLGPALAYSPVASSPIYHAGLDLLTLYGIDPGNRDFLGNPVSVPYSIGALNAAYGAPRLGCGAALMGCP